MQIDIPAALRIKQHTGTDLLKCMTDGEHLMKVWAGLLAPEVVLSVVCCIECPTITDFDTTFKEWCAKRFDGMSSDESTDLTLALVDEVADAAVGFIPARARPMAREMMLKAKSVQMQMEAEATTKAAELMANWDCTRELKESMTPGSGLADSVQSSEASTAAG